MKPIDWSRPKPDARPHGDFRNLNAFNATIDGDPSGLNHYDCATLPTPCHRCGAYRITRRLSGEAACRRCGDVR